VDVPITLTLPSGANITKMRRFMRAPAPTAANASAVTTVQVDHESPGLLFDGIRRLANGWFGSPGDKLQEWGREGLTFVSKGGLRPNRALMRPGQEANYTAQWAELHAYLDNASAAGVHVMSWIGLDTWAICRTGYPATGEGEDAGCQKLRPDGTPVCSNASDPNPASCKSGHHVYDPVAAAELEAYVFDNVRQLRHHPAVAGYYGCDDCCHLSKGVQQRTNEYRQLAEVHELIFARDPYHRIFGTIACDETWLWMEDGFGLGLDVVEKEGYGPGVGEVTYAAEGTPFSLRDYPMTHEPIWSMPAPNKKGSTEVLRSAMYANAIDLGSAENAAYCGAARCTELALNGTAAPAIAAIARELSSLVAAFRSRAPLDAGFVAPIARVAGAGRGGARAWREASPPGLAAEAKRGYFCVIVVALAGLGGPTTLAVDHVFGGSGGRVPAARVQPHCGAGPRPPIAAEAPPTGTAAFQHTLRPGIAQV
jgi:hypothetical protein